MDSKLWQQAVDFHGHTCGGLALGVRAAMEAQKRFNIERSGDEEVVCVTENDACGVDGIQFILGCTLGKGNLIYHGTGKFAFNFFDRRTGDAFRLMARDKKEGMHGPEYIEYVLSAPLEEVFDVSAPRIPVPEKARSLTSLKCDVCGEAAPENKMRFMNGKPVCLDCYTDYNRGW
ncbi:MAG: FmdE family protein [Bacillota bacterium]|nr:FmdE family protein [Bacillota bacterium]